MIPFAPYEPDKAAVDPAASAFIQNVLPQAGSYAPLLAPTPISAPLDSACRGAVSVRLTDGTWDIYAGTATNLYRLNRSNFTWTDVTGNGPYNLQEGYSWSFKQWLDKLVAVNGNNQPQVINVDSGTVFADLGTAPYLPPQGRYVFGSGGHLVIANSPSNPYRLTRSGVRDITSWRIGRAGADYQDLDEGGDITGGVGNQNGAYIFAQKSVYGMVNIPDDIIGFAIQHIEPQRGCIAPQSIVQVGNDAYFLSEDGFYRLGSPSTPIGAERVNRTFFDSVSQIGLAETQGAFDPNSQTIFWRYVTEGGSRLLLYNWMLDRWSSSDIDLEFIFGASTIATSLEALDTLGYTLETVPYSLDSRAWAGGRPTMAGFDSQHRLCFLQGATLEATLETADIAMGGENLRGFVSGFRVVGDAEDPRGQVGTQSTHNGARTWGLEYGTDVTGHIPSRKDGRLTRFRVRVPSAVNPWTHVVGVEPIARPTGRR